MSMVKEQNNKQEFVDDIMKSIDKRIDLFVKSFIEYSAQKIKVSKKDLQACYDSFVFDDKKNTKTNILSNSKGITIVTEYSDKCHAIFGDTIKIKETILKPAKCRFNKNLKFGPGWIISKEGLKDLEIKLKENGEKFTKQTREELEKETEDEDNADEEENVE